MKLKMYVVVKNDENFENYNNRNCKIYIFVIVSNKILCTNNIHKNKFFEIMSWVSVNLNGSHIIYESYFMYYHFYFNS